jgi:hypothetical protein
MSARDNCLTCDYFRNDPAELEAAFPGLTSLSSAANASRADDGICLKRDLYVSSTAWCADHKAALSMLS